MTRCATDTFIEPVILPVPAHKTHLRGREKVAFLSRYARSALGICADRMGIRLPSLEKDQNGAPVPFDGVHWSLTHKAAYVGAVLAFRPIGIDIERIRPFQPGLFKKIAADTEWALMGRTDASLARLWSAKEAVLKAGGTGIGNLSRCRVTGIGPPGSLTVEYRRTSHRVWLHALEGHVAAVVDPGCPVRWHIITRPLDTVS